MVQNTSECLTRSYAERSDLQWTVVDDEAVIVDLRRDVYYLLNETGTCVWDAVTHRSPLQQAVKAICRRFDVPQETAERDVIRLVKHLSDEQLIGVAERP